PFQFENWGVELGQVWDVPKKRWGKRCIYSPSSVTELKWKFARKPSSLTTFVAKSAPPQHYKQ
ncbi:3776_t:CDS:1, partial [Paraglomus occultum]